MTTSAGMRWHLAFRELPNLLISAFVTFGLTCLVFLGGCKPADKTDTQSSQEQPRESVGMQYSSGPSESLIEAGNRSSQESLERISRSLLSGDMDEVHGLVAGYYSNAGLLSTRQLVDFSASLTDDSRRQLLGCLGDYASAEELLPYYAQAHSSKDAPMLSLIESVVEHADEQGVQALADTFDGCDSPDVKSGIAQMMTKIRSNQAIEALADLAGGEPAHSQAGDDLSSAALAALVRMGSVPSTWRLAELIESEKDPARYQEYCIAFSMVQSAEAIPALFSIAKGIRTTQRVELRLAAVNALSRIDRQAATSLLSQLLSDPIPEIREAVARALKASGNGTSP